MTQKLTAEKARQLLDELKAGGGIVATQPRRDLFVEAVQLALLVLEAQQDAENYGSGFVACFSGQEPKKADANRVVITFTDLGLGHGD